MIKYYGIPILLAYVLGYLFPYVSLSLSYLAFFLLLIMMFFTLISFDLNILKSIKNFKREVILGLSALYLFQPLVQWILCYFLIKDKSLSFGTFFASITPIAIVAPMFTAKKKGNKNLSIILLILSVCLYPLSASFHLIYLKNDAFSLQLSPIILDCFLLISIPIILAFLFRRYFKMKLEILEKISPYFNQYAIAFMAFAYFGSSISKLNLYYTSKFEVLSIILIVFMQDFLTYFISLWFFKKMFSHQNAQAISISISMKNFALSGGLLLFYDPKASLASALGFLAHSVFFSYLMLSNSHKNYRKIT